MGFLRKLAKSVANTAVSTAKFTLLNPVTAVVKGAADISRGDSDALYNRGTNFAKSQAQDARSSVANTLNVLPNLANDTGIEGDSILNSSQIQAKKEKATQDAADVAAAAEEAARPEKERQAMFNQQYQNNLLKGGGRKYNTLLGGGY